MGVAYNEIWESIDRLVDNADIRTLYDEWVRADKSDGLPDYALFDPDQRILVRDNLMTLVPDGDEFRYEHYGSQIAEASGFDMSGRSTSDFDSDLGRFFRDKYQEALHRRRPLYTEHHAEHARSVLSWERLMLPVRGTDGAHRIVCFNTPLDKKGTMFDGLLDASLDGILLLRPVFDGSGAVADFVFAIANRRALEIMQKSEQEVIGRSLLDEYPEIRESVFALYCRVWASGQPERTELDHRDAGSGRIFRLSAVKAAGKVIVTFADITELRETQEQLESQRTELQYTNEALEEQAANLVEIAEDKDQAFKEARDAERFVADLIDTIPVPVFLRRPDGRLGRVNRQYADLYGKDIEDVTGRELCELLPEKMAQTIDERDRELFASPDGQQVYEADLTFPAVGSRHMVLHKAVLHDTDERTVGIAGVIVDMTENHRLRQELERLATTDPLTGLSNRRVFLERAGEEVGRARRNGKPVSVIMIDVDHFKSINDGFGHDAGDAVLVRLAEIVRGALRKSGDLVARFGGEEFVILAPETSLEGATSLAERLRETIAEAKVPTAAGVVRFTASFGVTVIDASREAGIETALKQADDALYSAKRRGRNRVELHSTPTAAALVEPIA